MERRPSLWRLGNIVGAGLCPTVVAGLQGSLCQERVWSGMRMGQHDGRGRGDARFPRTASGIWPQVNGMR